MKRWSIPCCISTLGEATEMMEEEFFSPVDSSAFPLLSHSIPILTSTTNFEFYLNKSPVSFLWLLSLGCDYPGQAHGYGFIMDQKEMSVLPAIHINTALGKSWIMSIFSQIQAWILFTSLLLHLASALNGHFTNTGLCSWRTGFHTLNHYSSQQQRVALFSSISCFCLDIPVSLLGQSPINIICQLLLSRHWYMSLAQWK